MPTQAATLSWESRLSSSGNLPELARARVRLVLGSDDPTTAEPCRDLLELDGGSGRQAARRRGDLAY